MARLEIEGKLVQDLLEARCCVLEHELFPPVYLFYSAEKLLTGTQSINTKKNYMLWLIKELSH